MDLPTCPACGQSVLDEDEENCPFCGASMSAKPSAKPARPAKPAAPTPAKAPAAKPAATAPKAAAAGTKTAGQATRSAPAAKAAPPARDDDPFAVDTVAGEKAITLSPAPLKGRTHAVTCPMCETTGYTTPKAAGQEVRCANPKCLVPIFTAPEIKKEEPAPEPKRSPASAVILGVSALVGVVIVGAVLWFFLAGGDKAKTSDPGQFAANPKQIAPTDDAAQKKADETRSKRSSRPRPRSRNCSAAR